MKLRNVHETDYSSVIRVIDAWWGGRQVAGLLPRLFFQHFQDTSFVIDDEGELRAFLIGFVSQTYPDQAYIHFVGVHPDYRQQGLGEQVYRHFFEVVKSKGCKTVGCITSPVNKTSIAFHTCMGFAFKPSETIVEGIPVQVDYDGLGGDRVVFLREL